VPGLDLSGWIAHSQHRIFEEAPQPAKKATTPVFPSKRSDFRIQADVERRVDVPARRLHTDRAYKSDTEADGPQDSSARSFSV
jgi:hypothetical protein